MNTETIGMIAAGLGLLGSIAYFVMGFIGIKTLREVRDRLERR